MPWARLIKITDPLNHATTLTDTSAGLIQSVTDAQGNVTTYGYDGRGNRTTVKDALGNTTTLTYDPMNRLLTNRVCRFPWISGCTRIYRP
jgi:YD repeat-containing protein